MFWFFFVSIRDYFFTLWAGRKFCQAWKQIFGALRSKSIVPVDNAKVRNFQSDSKFLAVLGGKTPFSCWKSGRLKNSIVFRGCLLKWRANKFRIQKFSFYGCHTPDWEIVVLLYIIYILYIIIEYSSTISIILTCPCRNWILNFWIFVFPFRHFLYQDCGLLRQIFPTKFCGLGNIY